MQLDEELYADVNCIYGECLCVSYVEMRGACRQEKSTALNRSSSRCDSEASRLCALGIADVLQPQLYFLLWRRELLSDSFSHFQCLGQLL